MSDAAERNRDRYNRMAASYERLLRLGSLGGIARLYRAVAEALDPVPGGTLVELGCGPGVVTPYLRPKVAPDGTVIGVDIADEMIARAEQRARREGWADVRYLRSDACDFAPPAPVDAVVFSLSLTTLPDCERALLHATSLLRPGGQLVILDSLPDPSHPFANGIIRAKARFVGARPTRLPLEFIETRLDAARVRHLSGGVYSVLSARRRTLESAS